MGVAPSSAPATPQPADGAPESESERYRRAKANAELLKEVVEVVSLRPPEDRGDFGNLVDTLNQGASLEGVYNGFVHSASYRRLELGAGQVRGEALQVFAEELAHLQLQLPEPTEFDESAAKPLQVLSAYELAQGPGGDGVSGQGRPAGEGSLKEAKDEKALTERYKVVFRNASVYTLKRVLGDEALKVVAAKSGAPQELHAWYGRWVVRLAARNVDFGLALRNRADEAFHSDWARKVSADQLKWEVLNRLHRLVNSAYRKSTG